MEKTTGCDMEGRDRFIRLLIGLGVAVAILLGRIFFIQIIDPSYKESAVRNSMVEETIYPTRGVIYDRNGDILVGNKVAYDILVTPSEVQPFDTAALASVLDVSEEFIRGKMDEYRRNTRRIGYTSVVMIKQLPAEIYMRFAEVHYKFPGFKGQVRSIRDYPFNAGGNLLGYVSEVDRNYIERHGGVYKIGDYAGKTGIEAAMEETLRGEKGCHIYLRNGQGGRAGQGRCHHDRRASAAVRTAADAEQGRGDCGNRTVHRRDSRNGFIARHRREPARRHRPPL